jgi:hypothetical protein
VVVEGAEVSRAAALLGALAVPSRLELLAAVVRRQRERADCSVRALAAELDRGQRELVKDVVRLRECGLLSVDGGGMSVELEVLRAAAGAIDATFPVTGLLASEPDLGRFFRHGRLATMPENPNLKRRIAALLVRLLPTDRTLSEAEVNAALRPVHDDVASLRRLMVDLGLVTRNGSSDYRRREAA